MQQQAARRQDGAPPHTTLCRALRNVSFQTPQSHQVHECVSETEFVRDDRGTMLPAQAAEFRATFSVRGQLDIASGCACVHCSTLLAWPRPILHTQTRRQPCC